MVLFSLGTPSWQPLQNLLQKYPRHPPAVPQALASVTHFHQGGTHRSAEPGHRLGAQSGAFYASLGAESAKSLCGEASGLGGVRIKAERSKVKSKAILLATHALEAPTPRPTYLVTTVFWSILALRSSFCCWRTWIFSSRIMFFSACKRCSVKSFSARPYG